MDSLRSKKKKRTNGKGKRTAKKLRSDIHGFKNRIGMERSTPLMKKESGGAGEELENTDQEMR